MTSVTRNTLSFLGTCAFVFFATLGIQFISPDLWSNGYYDGFAALANSWMITAGYAIYINCVRINHLKYFHPPS